MCLQANKLLSFQKRMGFLPVEFLQKHKTVSKLLEQPSHKPWLGWYTTIPHQSCTMEGALKMGEGEHNI